MNPIFIPPPALRIRRQQLARILAARLFLTLAGLATAAASRAMPSMEG